MIFNRFISIGRIKNLTHKISEKKRFFSCSFFCDEGFELNLKEPIHKLP